MTDLAQTWATIAGHAMLIDPDAIRATIRSTLDDGLRAASYDGVGGRSAEVSSHPERVALNPRKDSSWADLDLIDHHVARFVSAVAELALRSRSGRPCADWEEAVQDAHLLAEMDAVSVLDGSGQRPARWVHAAGDAVHDLELIRDRHCARDANEHESTWTSGLADESCCRLCLRFRRRVEIHARGLCQAHWSLSQASRSHTDDGLPVDPPDWLTEELHRIGGPGPAWKRARSQWLLSLGPERRTA